MAKCPRCDWNGDFIEVLNTNESQCPNCGFQGNLDAPTWDDMTVEELKEACAAQGIAVPAKATKKDMIDLLVNP